MRPKYTPKRCECGCGQPAPIAKRTNTKLGHVAGQPVRFIVGHHHKVRPLRPISDRFWKKADKHSNNGCWQWTGAKDRRGYGVFGKQRKIYRAHRIAWELTRGPIPEGMSVCHKCDNPACVRPDHLFLGTHGDNMQDMISKGRRDNGERPRGELHGNAKLTEIDVRQIRRMFADGVIRAAICEKFNISTSSLYAIARRKIWKHI